MNRKRLGEIIAESKLLSAESISEALKIQQRNGKKIGEILLEMGIIDENELIEYLSKQLRIPMVPDDKIRMIPIPSSVLEKVPVEIAIKNLVLPIYMDKKSGTLTLVMENPLDLEAIEKVKRYSGSRSINTLIAGREVLHELVLKYYRRDEPFGVSPETHTIRDEEKQIEIIDADEDKDEVIETSSGIEFLKREIHKTGIEEIFGWTWVKSKRLEDILILDDKSDRGNAFMTILGSSGYRVDLCANPLDLPSKIKENVGIILLHHDSSGLFAPYLKEIKNKRPEIEILILKNPAELLLSQIVPYREMLNFCISSIDYLSGIILDSDFDVKFHSRRVASLARGIANTMGIPSRLSEEIFIAGYLHDFSKVMAKVKSKGEPLKEEDEIPLVEEFLDTVDSPFNIVPILKNMKRRFDRQGEEEDSPPICVGGKILKVAHAFEEYSVKKGSEEQALEYLKERSGTLFDPDVISALEKVLKQKKLLGDISRRKGDVNILIVDKDLNTLSQLESKLVREGYKIFLETDGFDAIKTMDKIKPDLIISELSIPGMDGLSLLRYVLKKDGLKDIPFILMSERSEPLNVTRGLEMGAWDFIVKPLNIPILISKIKKLVDKQKARPIEEGLMARGNLKEFNLPDIVQVMSLGLKTGKVEIKGILNNGTIFFDKGEIIYAETDDGKRGSEAFYNLCEWDRGEFLVSLTRDLPEKNIYESNEYLLLEGMRRLDEKQRYG